MDLDLPRNEARAALFLFVFTLILGAANLLFTAHQTTAVRGALAASLRAEASTMQLCQAGNEARAQQAGLWDYLIHLSKPPATAQGREVLAKFEAHLHVVFAPRNCAAIARGGKRPVTPRPVSPRDQAVTLRVNSGPPRLFGRVVAGSPPPGPGGGLLTRR